MRDLDERRSHRDPSRAAPLSRAALLEFWFEFASTYSYPAALRIEAGAPFRRPSAFPRNALLAARGVFGAPSFTVGDEPFWGNDRLEAALACWRAQS